MFRFILRCIFALLLVGAALAQTSKPPVAGKCHIILLDVSGSMKQRYENNLRGWLLDPLLSTRVFSPGDRVILRSFDVRRDQPRLYDGQFDHAAILNKVPASVTPFDTDLPMAIDLALGDIKELAITSDVLIWMITDNEEDAHGVKEIDPLYQRISTENRFRAAYIFPLTNENNVKIAPQKSAMVMYLLRYSPNGSTVPLNAEADEVGHKIKNDPITWFPIEKSIVLDESNLKIDDQQSQLVDGRLVLPDVPEGTPIQFNVDFQFRSQLRGREVTGGKLPHVSLAINLPESVQSDGDKDDWSGVVNPPILKIKPKQKSSEFYHAQISANNLSLHPATFWQAVWNDTSEPIYGDLNLTLNDVETQMDSETLSQVENLNEIKKIVRQSQARTTTIPLGVTFKVGFNSLWRRAVVAVGAIILAGLLAVGASLFFFKSRYELTSPQGEQILSFPLLGRSYLSIGNEHAAVLQRRFGGLVVSPVGTYVLDGGIARPRSLDGNRDAFALENQSEGRRYEYTIRRLVNVKQPQISRDDFLD